MSYVIAIGLGPVQDFIATARRCRDLRFGSWLLSELSKAAAGAIAGLEGESSLIFPPPGTDLAPNGEDAISNKLLAVVDDPASAAQKAEDAARHRLNALATQTFASLENEIDLDAALAQANDLLEWNWTAARIENGDFAGARAQAERALAARKACRDFGSAQEWASHEYKSSLDGARESVIGKYTLERLDALALYENFGLRPGERLCGVGLLKRQGQRGAAGSRIASTSHVAAQGLLERWRQTFKDGATLQDARQRVAQFEKDLRVLGLNKQSLGNVPESQRDAIFEWRDGHLLFPNRLAEFFAPPDKSTDDQKRDTRRQQEAAVKLLDHRGDAENEKGENEKGENEKGLLQALGGAHPHPYYALILADGDRMGEAISHAAHRGQASCVEISQRLAGFAHAVRPVVEEARGTLIYAGGDDVLALLPLHNALDVSRNLAHQFVQVFDGIDWLPHKPTLSVGLVVVHHLEPLSEALELVRRAEKSAKGVDGKNALAVTVSKRSGNDTTVAAQWSSSSDDLDGLDGRLQLFIRWARSGELATGLAYEWRDLARRVPLRVPPATGSEAEKQETVQHNATVGAIWQAESKRILARKRERSGEKETDEKLLDQLKGLIDTACENARQKDTRQNEGRATGWLSDLADEMVVAREFAAAQNLALYQSYSAPVLQEPVQQTPSGDTSRVNSQGVDS